MFGARFLRAYAHEHGDRGRKTVLMNDRAHRPKFEAEEARYSVVADWFDGCRMEPADLSDEIVGRRVIAGYGDAPGGRLPGPWRTRMQPELMPASGRRPSPGVLFLGDDGDSLWFWPDEAEIAFRFDPSTVDRVRRSLDENVSRLVSQGALVSCRWIEDASDGGAVLEFPAAVADAA